jgi:hypothetical protein
VKRLGLAAVIVGVGVGVVVLYLVPMRVIPQSARREIDAMKCRDGFAKLLKDSEPLKDPSIVKYETRDDGSVILFIRELENGVYKTFPLPVDAVSACASKLSDKSN